MNEKLTKNTTMNYWLVKSEPDVYSWDTFVKDGKAVWDGVRNFQARNNLKEMKVGDEVFFYHTGDERQIVGTAKVVKEYYQDPTTDDTNWVVVTLTPLKPLKIPITLPVIKTTPTIKNISLLKQGRLSVCAITSDEWNEILRMGNGAR